MFIPNQYLLGHLLPLAPKTVGRIMRGPTTLHFSSPFGIWLSPRVCAVGLTKTSTTLFMTPLLKYTSSRRTTDCFKRATETDVSVPDPHA